MSNSITKHVHRLWPLWLPLVFYYLSGCTPYYSAEFPSHSGEAQSSSVPPSPGFVEVGQEVRIYLLVGNRVEGEVVRVDPDEIVIGTPGNYGLSEKAYKLKEISHIEVLGNNAVYNTLGVVIIVSSALVFGAFFALYFSLRGMGEF